MKSKTGWAFAVRTHGAGLCFIVFLIALFLLCSYFMFPPPLDPPLKMIVRPPHLFKIHHAFSPWIVATTRRVCRAARNSRYQIPCHVPVASLPSLIGMVTLAPIRALLMCACGFGKCVSQSINHQVGWLISRTKKTPCGPAPLSPLPPSAVGSYFRSLSPSFIGGPRNRGLVLGLCR